MAGVVQKGLDQRGGELELGKISVGQKELIAKLSYIL